MQQKFLNFSVDGQNIRTPHQKVIADSRNYLSARFSFDEVWQGLTKTAVFQGSDGKVYHVLLEGDCCMVPAEVIKPTRFTVSVFGGDRLTTDRAVVEVAASGMVAGVAPPVPTPDIYTQLTETVALERQIAQSAAVTATEKAEQCAAAAKNTDEILETVVAANEIAAGAVECAENARAQAVKAEAAADTAATHAAYAEQKAGTAVSAANTAINASRDATDSAEDAHIGARAAADSAAAAAESARVSQLAEQRLEPKLLKTVTLEQDAPMIEISFDHPVKEFFMVFKGNINSDTTVSDCIFATRCNGGVQYFNYSFNMRFSILETAVFFLHAKEIAERYWQVEFPATMLSPSLQGLDANTANMRVSYSYRVLPFKRYVSDLNILMPQKSYLFRAGTSVEVWGVEAE